MDRRHHIKMKTFFSLEKYENLFLIRLKEVLIPTIMYARLKSFVHCDVEV